MSTPSETEDTLIARLAGETARLGWRELQVFYARGQVVGVAPELDLVRVAACLARDDSDTLRQWMGAGQVGEITADQARQWHDRDSEVWTVVVAPWVVVQAAD